MRALVTGGTGAIGSHVCQLLADSGWDVYVTTRRARERSVNIQYIQGDAKDQTFLNPILTEGWDVIIDFMIWSTEEFSDRYKFFLSNTNQYIFTSSYRVYADCSAIDEKADRLIDVLNDKEYLATDEYALRKARCENMLFSSASKNWTIVRPAITYDGLVGRLQLGVIEAPIWLWRAQNSIPIPLPKEMLNKQTTMTWGGDVARMISALANNDRALGEVFNVSTSDHLSWAEVVKIYCEVQPFEIVPCDSTKFELAQGGIYQIRYDRMYNRIINNNKILNVTRINESSLRTMRDGLVRELHLCLANDVPMSTSVAVNARYDRLLGSTMSFKPLLKDISKDNVPLTAVKYTVRRLFG